MRRTIATATIVALALALASCGGSEKTETVSKRNAVGRLEAACLAGQQAGRKQFEGRGGRMAYLDAIRVNLETIQDRLKDVEVSGRRKADFNAYKATLQKRLDAIARIRSASSSERQRVIVAERPTISTAGTDAHEAIVRLGARHVCP